MAQPAVSPVSPDSLESTTQLHNNNPFKRVAQSDDPGKEAVIQTTAQSQDPGKEVAMNIEQSQDSDKQAVYGNARSESISAPIPVESEYAQSPTEPVREADKEVLSSWQSKSQDESGPIPMAYHESNLRQSDLLTDIKGSPPAYDDLSPQNRTPGDDILTTPTSIEPDGSSSQPPRPEERTAVGQLLSWIPPAPRVSPAQLPPLIQPVAIAQLDVPPQGESVPFIRCYSDVLASRGVSMKEFTAFLDGFAVALAPNSALQGLKLFGVGVAAVPLPLIPLAGRGLKALASTGSGHSSSRAKLYIERARKEYFEPRGLRLSILNDKDLNPRLQIPSHAYRLAPLTKNTLSNSLRERRMEGVAPYVAPLRFDVPEQDKQIKGVQKLARKHLESRVTNDLKRVVKLRERQWQDITFSNGQYGVWDDRYAAKMSELRNTQLQLAHIQRNVGLGYEKSPVMKEALDQLWKEQRELQLLVSERQMALQNLTGRRGGVEAEMREETLSRGLNWILIENL